MLAELAREHEAVARILTALQRLVDDPGPGDAVATRSEFERLAGELEAHLDHEEHQLVPVLNMLPGDVEL